MATAPTNSKSRAAMVPSSKCPCRLAASAFAGDRERGRFDSYTGNDDIRGPYPDRVEEFFKEKGFRVSRIAPQERPAVK